MLAVQAAVPAAAKRGGFRMFSSRRYGGLLYRALRNCDVCSQKQHGNSMVILPETDFRSAGRARAEPAVPIAMRQLRH